MPVHETAGAVFCKLPELRWAFRLGGRHFGMSRTVVDYLFHTISERPGSPHQSRECALVYYGATGTALVFRAQRSPDARSYVVRSDDNGMTWHFLQNPPCATGQSSLPAAPVGSRTYALCADGDRIVHLPYTDDDGKSWSSGGATVTLATLDENVQVSAFAKSILISAADGSPDLFQVTATASRRIMGAFTRSHDVRQTSCDDISYAYYSIRGA